MGVGMYNFVAYSWRSCLDDQSHQN